MKVIAFYNLKGGVGKTASAVNLSYLAAAAGYKVLLWDLDPQGSSSFYFQTNGLTVKNAAKKLLQQDIVLTDVIQPTAFVNIDVVPADMSARQADIILDTTKQSKKRIKQLLQQVTNYDVVILDAPPGISLLHDNIFTAADWVLMPNIPTTLSIRSYEMVISYFEEQGYDTNRIKCFFSMVDHRKNLHHEVVQQFYKQKIFFKSYIPYLSDIEKMGVHQQALFEYANTSYAAQCYRDLWNEIEKYCIKS
jgi:cellulose biosynthesis protein BcsQ